MSDCGLRMLHEARTSGLVPGNACVVVSVPPAPGTAIAVDCEHGHRYWVRLPRAAGMEDAE